MIRSQKLFLLGMAVVLTSGCGQSKDKKTEQLIPNGYIPASLPEFKVSNEKPLSDQEISILKEILTNEEQMPSSKLLLTSNTDDYKDEQKRAKQIRELNGYKKELFDNIMTNCEKTNFVMKTINIGDTSKGYNVGTGYESKGTGSVNGSNCPIDSVMQKSTKVIYTRIDRNEKGAATLVEAQSITNQSGSYKVNSPDVKGKIKAADSQMNIFAAANMRKNAGTGLQEMYSQGTADFSVNTNDHGKFEAHNQTELLWKDMTMETSRSWVSTWTFKSKDLSKVVLQVVRNGNDDTKFYLNSVNYSKDQIQEIFQKNMELEFD